MGLARLESAGIKMMIISTEKNIVVKKRAEKLGIECIHGSTDKKNEIEMICKEHSINPNDAIFVGNDINDIPALNFVGIPIGVADSYEEIYPHISFITKKNGGEGAVREICDHIYFSLKKLMEQALSRLNYFDVSSKTVVITGASGQLGLEYQMAFLKNGAKVIGLDIKKSEKIIEIEKSYKDSYLF